MEKSVWYFTFCSDDPVHGGYCQPIKGTFGSARQKMCELYGTHWAFQYSTEEWMSIKCDPERWWPVEKELPLIEVADEN